MAICIRHKTSTTWDRFAIDVLLLTAPTTPTLLQSTCFFLAPSLMQLLITLETQCYHNTLDILPILKGQRPIKSQSRPRASLVTQLVKNPPAMWETWVQSLRWEDPLEKGKATHSSILA